MRDTSFALAYGLAACGIGMGYGGVGPALVAYVLVAAVFAALVGMAFEKGTRR